MYSRYLKGFLYLIILLLSVSCQKRVDQGFLLVAKNESLPILNCKSAILIDAAEGKVLFEKNAHELIAPASMTKLVSIWVVLQGVHRGDWSLDDLVPVSSAADYKRIPRDSSLMFIEQGDRVTLRELLTGLAVSSGNDAAIAVAEYTYGTVDNFVDQMNKSVQALGLVETLFVDPSGYGDSNRTTAFEFSKFCRIYIQTEEDTLASLTSVASFSYPKKANIPRWRGSSVGMIVQANHNELVGSYEGVDGLKSGYIDEAGYNLSLTAKKGDTRLIAVLMGGPGATACQRSIFRSVDSSTLLTWGFDHFQTVFLHLPELPMVRLKSADGIKVVPIEAEEIPGLTIRSSHLNKISYKIESVTKMNSNEDNRNSAGEWFIYLNDEMIISGNLFVESRYWH